MLQVDHTVWPVLVLALACDSGTTGGRGRASGDRDARANDATTGAGGARVGGVGAGGEGGRSSSGGSTTSGGAPSSGGETAGIGGATAVGGAVSSGGNAGRSGTPEAGGAPSSGGTGTRGSGGAGGVAYATSFDLTESPISESGAWHHDGLDWTRVDTGAGKAFGTEALGVARSGPTGYDDSYAHLSGFPSDQQASAVVALGTIDASCTHEVEILLRWTDSAHSASGYECNVAWDGAYAQIVRWNGPVGDYTYLGSGSVPGGMHDGDTVSASIIGDQLTLSVNGVVRATAQDSTFPTGDPGMGFWRGMSGCGTSGDYGFSSYSASSVP